VGLEFRILGPLEAVRAGRALRLGGRKQRTLLAMLVLRAGEPVPPDVLIEALWPAYDSAAPSRLQVYVSQLRKALGAADAIEMRPGGYALAVGPEAVDAFRFEHGAAAGRAALAAGEPERAAATLREALALWRGPALGDLPHEPFAQAAARLAELRLAAVEDRLAADLELGRDVLAEVQALVAEHPLRERLRGAVMLALYRAGRQADALDSYLAAHWALVEELGVEPGPELRELHAAILRQDASLVVESAEVRARRHLPAPATSLVGRRAQLAELVALVRRDDVRLVTLTGPGGGGKTRLAIRAAHDLAPHFEHGVYFTALAAVEDAAVVPDAVAASLAVEEQPGRPIADTLAARLRDRRLLLVLDNFEHVDDAAPLVSTLLAVAPGLTVLATSRWPLRLYGEHEYPVPPLADSEAADLFVVRARAARRDVEVRAEAVAEICARLDGLPLAIELAAARSRTLAPAEMLDSLPRLELAAHGPANEPSHRLELAAHGPRDVPERQRTLRAALGWSYRLLTERERELLARLGVFAGGWDEASARAVCSATPPELAALATQSLLVASAERFDMLETVREYALERLADDGGEERMRRHHAEHFTALAEAAEPELAGDRGPEWLRRLEAEHANLRAALGWAGRAGAVELELRLVAALARFWVVGGHLNEGRSRLDGALAEPAGQPARLRARALAGATALALSQGDYRRMTAYAGEALELYRTIDDRRGVARALDGLATAAANLGDHGRSRALYEQSIALCRELGDDGLLAICTTNLGCLDMMDGELERARELSEEAVVLYRRTAQRDRILQPLGNLATVARLQGRLDDAVALIAETLGLALELGYEEGVMYCLEGQAGVHADRGEGEHAAMLLGAAGAAAERLGSVLEPFERDLHDRTAEAVRSALGDAAFAAAVAAGRELDIPAAAARAQELARRSAARP
jgi:predicted ATPase/DNA-binding SARP family transcriptional activator